jgi:hypothetical protein
VDRLVTRPRRSELIRVAAVFVVGAAVGAGAIGVVGRHLAGVEAQTTSGPASVVVHDATFGRTQHATATAAWTTIGTIFSPGDGTLTRITDSGGTFASGDVVCWIDERPVFLIDGAIPAYRDLASGIGGEDVAALQSFLADRGYAVDPDRLAYTVRTEAGVRAWQVATHQAVTGRVQRSDVVFAPFTDGRMRLRWRPGVTPGVQVASGMELLDRLDAAPAINLDLTGSVAGQLEQGVPGTLLLADGATAPVVLGRPVSRAGLTVAALTAPDGGPACPTAACADRIPIDGETAVGVEFVLVPELHGPAVPVAAIESQADGTAFVETSAGRRPVIVKAVSGGLAIVEGLSVGEIVQLP